jgi:serine/threonine-protein kinase
LIGQQLAHFRILDLLGEGGMGAVYRAEDTKLGREVAVKVLPEAFVADAERLARFEREAKVLAALDHPNIAGIYEVGQDDRVHFLAMQLAPGEDLAQVLAAGTPSLENALTIALQIAIALEAAHATGIVHRDLKPANVKVASDAGSGVAVKVLDFGLAKAWDEQSSADGSLSMSPTLTAQMTQAGVILGTAGYMSPEQARGQEADARADVWSFGVMLWEMVTGQRLFQEDTVSDTLAAVLKTQIDLGKLPDDLPPPIHRLVSRCLERDVRSRLQAIGEARVAIESYLADPHAETVTPRGEATPEAMARPSALRRWTPLAIAVHVAGLVSSILTREFQPEAPEPAVRRFAIKAEGFDAGWTSEPVISPDGTAIAYPSEQGITIRYLAQLEPRILDVGAPPNWVIWSPDSQHIAYETESKIFRVDLARGGSRFVADLPEARRAIGAAWLADDTLLLGSWRRNAFRVSANGGDPEVWLDMGELGIDIHRFLELPEGHGILAYLHRESDWVLLCLRGSEQIELDDTLWPIAYTADGRLLFTRFGDGNLWAAAFDPATLQFTGEPALVASDVGWTTYAGDGTLVFGSEVTSPKRVPAIVDREGTTLETFGEAMDYLEIGGGVSPDGRYIATVYQAEGASVNNVFVYDRQRSVWSRLTTGETDQGYVTWSTDGQRLYFRNGSNVATIRRDGVGGAQDLFPGNSPRSSPDGKTLLFRLDPGTLMMVGLGDDGLPTGEPTPVAGPSAGTAFRGGVSPDGQFLVYGSAETGNGEIYLTEFPVSESRWQVSLNGGSEPLWSPDGSAIYYREGGQLWEVSFALDDNTPQLGSASVLFHQEAFSGALRTGYASLAGGSFLVAKRVGEEGPDEPTMIVIQSAMSELEQP